MKKRILSLLLALVLAVSLLPTSAFAADGESNHSDPPKVGWKITKNEKPYTESTEADRLPLATKEENKFKTVKKISFNQNDKIIFSVNVDPQYAENTTYEWHRYMRQWNGTKIDITDFELGETSSTLTMDGIYAGTGKYNRYYCVVSCTIGGKVYTGRIIFQCTVSAEDPLLAPTFYKQPMSATYKRLDSSENLIVTVNSAHNSTPDDIEHLTYQWYSAESETGEGKAIENATSGTYKPDTSKIGTTYYYCVVKDNLEYDNKVYSSGAVTSKRAKIQVVEDDFSQKGAGTAEDPIRICLAEDLKTIREKVTGGTSFEGVYFRFENDITLPEGWTPIGCTVDGTNKFNPNYEQEKDNLRPFSGTIDGNDKLLTIPEGGKPLLAYVKNATVKNLNIYGEKINGYALVDGLHGVGFTGGKDFAIVIENVTLKKGSSTLKSGLIGAEIDNTVNGFAGVSAAFTTTIRNCTIEEGVTIGYDGTQSEIGSIAGRMQGTVENCVSYATVKGVNYVGGIIGTRDNAMGICTVNNCTFGGTVEATGSYVGGIVGGGYGVNSSAPNGIRTTVTDCKVTDTASVTGQENVGGILGGDGFVAQAWNGYSFKNNTFLGKIKGESNVGGIIGYYRSLNKFDNISNNIYAADCGATKGIAAVQYVDTNQFANLTEKDGTTYFNTSKMEINKRDTNTLYLYANDGTLMKGPTVRGCDWKADHNRTDDPLGKDAVKLCRSTNESLLPDDNGAGTPGNAPATGDTGVLVWVIALPVTILAAAFVLKRKERQA